MDDGGRLWIGIVICVVIVAVMAFFSACESAAIEFNDSKLKKLAEENPRAKKLEKLLEQPNKLVTANLISRSIMIIMISAASTVCFFKPISSYFYSIFGIHQNEQWKYAAVDAVAFIVLLAVISLVITVFGINIPKKLCISEKIGEGFILSACGIYKFWLALFKPLEAINEWISKGLLRLFGVKSINRNESVTEEEILMMVDAVNETGAIEESQAEMISNIFEFDDLEVREVMTHRTEVVGIEENEDIISAVKLAIDEGFSRIPVYTESIDNICGVIFAKDMLKFVGNESAKGQKVKKYMRDICFVPESNSCREVFKKFTEEKIQIAVAVDEYGGTAGIITMEDLLETIVGNIQDEYDDETEEIQKVSENVFDMLGNADYSDAMETLGKTPREDGVYETIGGFVVDLLGYIPKDGATPSAHWEDIKFSVLKAEDNKIIKLRATVIQQPKEDNSEDS